MGVDRKMDGKTGTLRKQRGRASVVFENPPLIMAAAVTLFSNGRSQTCHQAVTSSLRNRMISTA